ncbi:hypothetical protein GGI05_005742 [Coemansia sp. RSA 2603]|nr:hypothetical protein GGI05_005742 [Coemansia sp. RSA 2603]
MPQPIPIPHVSSHAQSLQQVSNYDVVQQPNNHIQYAQQQPYPQQHQYHPGYQNHHHHLQPSYQHEHHHHQSQQLSHSMSQSAPVIYSSMPQLGHGDVDYYSSMPHYGSQPMGSNNGTYARPKKQVHFAE